MKNFIQFNEKIFPYVMKIFIFRDRKIEFVIKKKLQRVEKTKFSLFYNKIDEHRFKYIIFKEKRFRTKTEIQET